MLFYHTKPEHRFHAAALRILRRLLHATLGGGKTTSEDIDAYTHHVAGDVVSKIFEKPPVRKVALPGRIDVCRLMRPTRTRYSLRMGMTLNQLRYFCAVAETGNFGQAAERLHISQPPLSRQIAALEAHLGTELFERGPKGVTLTPAGQRLLIDARDVLRLANQAQRNATAARRGEVGRLTLGFTMCAAYSVVPTLARRFTAAFPNVEFRAREMMPLALEEALQNGAIDLAISFRDAASPGKAVRRLFREPLDVVVPREHRLARTRQLKVEDLAAETFLIVPEEQAPSFYDCIVRRCRSAGFTPTIGLEVYLQQTIVNFVAEGLGVAFVPSSMRKARVKGAVFKPVPNPPMIEHLLVWQSDNANPCITGFLSTAVTAEQHP